LEFSFEKYGQQFLLLLESSLPRILGALLILGIGWWLSNQAVRLMFRAMSRSKTDTGLVTFISSLAKVLLKMIVCITAAAQLGMNVGSIIAAIGAAGLTIGLAVKDNMANIACGAQIIFTKPFRVGDYILFEETEGTVERIETMFTTLRTFDNKEVVIPNSKITSGVIVNYSAMATRRLDLKYTVGYDEDIGKVKSLLENLSGRNSMVLDSPAPLVVVGEHGENGITVEVRAWCKTDDYLTLYFDMQEKVKLAFDEVGVRIPHNQLDVHLKPEE